MEGAGSCSLKERSARQVGTFPAGSLARLAEDAAEAKEPDLLLDAKDAGYMAKCLRPG
jgi:hypothetical protein